MTACRACGLWGAIGDRFCGLCGAPLVPGPRVRRFVAFSWVLLAVIAMTLVLCWQLLADDTDMAGLFLLPIILVDLVCLPLVALGTLAMRGGRRWGFALAVRAGIVAGGVVFFFLPLAIFVAPLHLAHVSMGRHPDVARWFRLKS